MSTPALLHIPWPYWTIDKVSDTDELTAKSQANWMEIQRWANDFIQHPCPPRPLHIPFKEWSGNAQEYRNLLEVENWSYGTDIIFGRQPLHIPFPAWAQGGRWEETAWKEHENYMRLEEWANGLRLSCNDCPTLTSSVTGPITTVVRTLNVSTITALDDIFLLIEGPVSGTASDLHVKVVLDSVVISDADYSLALSPYSLGFILSFGTSLIITFSAVGGSIDTSDLAISATCHEEGGG